MTSEKTEQLVGSGLGDHPSPVYPARAGSFWKGREGQGRVQALALGHHDGGDAVEAGPPLHLGRCLFVGLDIDLSIGNSYFSEDPPGPLHVGSKGGPRIEDDRFTDLYLPYPSL